jgi:hypothetical protein
MHKPKGIDPTQAHEKVMAGKATLVCAYDDEARCRKILLDHSMTRSQLEATLSSQSKDQEIIFYCS